MQYCWLISVPGSLLGPPFVELCFPFHLYSPLDMWLNLDWRWVAFCCYFGCVYSLFFYRFLLMNESILGVILFPGGGFRILYWQFYYLWQWERIDFLLRVNSLRDAGKKNVRKQVIWAFLVLIFYPWEKDEKSLKLNDSISQFHQHMKIAKFISTGRWWPRSLQPRYNSLKFIQSNENTISIRHHQLNSTLRVSLKPLARTALYFSNFR